MATQLSRKAAEAWDSPGYLACVSAAQTRELRRREPRLALPTPGWGCCTFSHVACSFLPVYGSQEIRSTSPWNGSWEEVTASFFSHHVCPVLALDLLLWSLTYLNTHSFISFLPASKSCRRTVVSSDASDAPSPWSSAWRKLVFNKLILSE